MTDAPFIDPGPDVYAEGFRRGVYSWLDHYIGATQEVIEDGVRNGLSGWMDDNIGRVEEAITNAVREAFTTWLASDEGKRIVRRALRRLDIDGGT